MYIFCSSFQLFTYTTFIVILLFSVFITMFNKCTISDELCSSYSLILSFTCFSLPPFNPFLLYNTLSRGLSRHHHVVYHVIHTTPISHTPSTIHNQSTDHRLSSLRTAATSTTSTTHSFTIPTELPSSKIPKSKLGPFHTFKTPTGAFAPCPSLTTTYSHLHWIQPPL